MVSSHPSTAKAGLDVRLSGLDREHPGQVGEPGAQVIGGRGGPEQQRP